MLIAALLQGCEATQRESLSESDSIEIREELQFREHSERERIAEHRIGDYRILLLAADPNTGLRRLEVWPASATSEPVRPAFEFDGQNLKTDKEYDREFQEEYLPFGVDIVGGSEPEIIVWERSGGNWCCTTHHIISLGEQVDLVQSIELKYSETTGWWEQDGDENWTLLASDWTFVSWKARGVPYSATGPLVLAEQSGVFVPSEKHMSREPVDRVSLETQASEIRGWMDEGVNDPQARLAQAMLDLMYSGQRYAASVLLDLVLPEGHPLRQDFENGFFSQLALSPWWPAVSKFNDPGVVGLGSE